MNINGTKDPRIVYGARCTWWDTVDKVSRSPSGLPCCPYCGSVLYECPSMEDWIEAAIGWDIDNPGYYDFLFWMRGKCYPSKQEAAAAYASYLETEENNE